MKLMMSPDELIDHMKKKGIRFTIDSEDDAKDFLQNNNYYMKLAAYRKNYELQKHMCSTKGQYINLEFAYLRELSVLDMELRYLINDMCLDIEHRLKVLLLKGVEDNKDDGYQIVRKFIAGDDKILKKVRLHKASEYCKDVIEKYYPYFPVWVFVEVITFGELTYLCDFYNKTYGDVLEENKFLNIVRDLRNASAHSNCLINNLSKEKTGESDIRILNFLKRMHCVSKASISNNLKYNFMYDFVVLLYVYDHLLPSGGMKAHRYKELRDLLLVRFRKNESYFKKNNMLVSQYRFLEKIIDSLTTTV